MLGMVYHPCSLSGRWAGFLILLTTIGSFCLINLDGMNSVIGQACFDCQHGGIPLLWFRF